MNDTSKRDAYTATLLFEATPAFGLSFLYRHIPYGFVSPFGELAASSIQSASNADGLYLGLEAALVPGVFRLNAYADVASGILPIADIFPRTSQDYQAAGYATLMENHGTGRKLEASVAVRDVHSETTSTVAGPLRSDYATIAHNQLTVRLEAKLRLGEDLSLKSRYEHVGVSDSASANEAGYLLLGEMAAMIRPLKLALDMSAARFQTASFQSAVYLFEPSVPGSGSILSLDGSGWRVAMRLSFQLLRTLKFSIAGAGSVYDTARTIGSGLTARFGRSSFDGSAQLDVTM